MCAVLVRRPQNQTKKHHETVQMSVSILRVPELRKAKMKCILHNRLPPIRHIYDPMLRKLQN